MQHWKGLCVVLLLIIVSAVVGQQIPASCEEGSCYTGNLLIGREDRLSVTSTCGSRRVERYCIVSHLQDVKKCFYCDSRTPYEKGVNELSHRIENIVTTFQGEDRKKMWWQSENGVQEVSLRFDLEAIFHFTHLIMTFKTFRPRALVIERSADFGRTWSVYRYFAYDCEESFPGVPTAPLYNIDDVICENRYSAVEPSTEGEVIFKVLPPNIRIDNPYSDDVQDMIKITNLRINFTELHTLGDIELDNRQEIREKYYYAIYDMVVRGSCHCYGHATSCIPAEGVTFKEGMVQGKCLCGHNTEGNNCERCQEFYNDQPWRPATHGQPNECKRCNCNSHTDRCHFDPAVFEITNGASGGVCDDCQHNTMGRNCEQCKPFFYMNPDRDIRDPNICVPCDCDPAGSENGGECESHTDPANNLIAGRCICKRFTTGVRCDTCQDGYWSLRAENPDGCQACACNTLGTEGNRGCDKQTGNCVCKRYVTGRNCDQCYEGYYGLSEDVYGCKYCYCDPGGAYNNSCNRDSGQCYCRPHITGRQCNQVESGYFYTFMDYFLYEAELSRVMTIDTVQLETRIRDENTYVSWTGSGFLRISEGGQIQIVVDNIPVSGDYEIVLRYEPLIAGTWEDVRISLTRPGEIPTQSICGNTIPQDDLLATSLPSGNRYSLLSSTFCLEKGKMYIINVDFNSFGGGAPNPNAQILLDSVVLIPRTTNFDMFSGSDNIKQNRREQWEYYRCGEAHLSAIHAPLSDICRELMFSMSAVMFDGAMACDCDPIGSKSSICDEFGGQCECKANVIGRRCDQCAPGTYGFGPNGCSACDCDGRGSLDNFCDPFNGQCACIPNTYGRACDQCAPGFWNFPNCLRCECNGHAPTCDSQTGACENCQDFTVGHYCERCQDGYYGDPTLGTNLPCQPCMCPGGEGSGHQFADTCYIDQTIQTVVCICEEGYTGIRCDQCDNNYYGYPSVPGGSCNLCNCNGNTNPLTPGNCDATTGECLRCLYNTAGFNCDVCAPNYYGDALLRTCRPCDCNFLGTDLSICDLNNNCGVCDRVTGKCPCLPNVVGQTCDQCAPDHWKLASGAGCEACDCCEYGSTSTQCNEFTGQCTCQSGFGGRTCCECESLFFGDPLVGCERCQCDPQGSETLQCNGDGSCVCRPGVTGKYCDRCAHGTTGEVPNCEPCGECFDDWDEIINALRVQTEELLERARNIKSTGATAAYDDEFNRLEGKLRQVESLLTGPSITVQDLDGLHNDLDEIRADLDDLVQKLDAVNNDLQRTQVETFRANRELGALEAEGLTLNLDAEDLRDEIVIIESSNVEGAFKSILESRNKSQAAQATVDAAEGVVSESSGIRDEVERIMAERERELAQKQQDYQDRLREVDNQLTGLEARLGELNEKVCGGPGDTCSGGCGGAGCDFCGGLGCQGSISMSEVALDRATQANDKFLRKKEQADSTLAEMDGVRGQTMEALDLAKMAYDAAAMARDDAQGAQTNLTGLLQAINDFIDSKRVTPAEIQQVARMALETQISSTPEEIQDLAKQIEDTVATLENIDQILNDTAEDLAMVRALKERADKAKEFADDVLASAESVVAALAEAAQAQDTASNAIKEAEGNINDANDNLIQIESEAGAAIDKANDLDEKLTQMEEQLSRVQGKFTDNEEKIRTALNFANTADADADQAIQSVGELEAKFNQTSDQVMTKSQEASDARKKAEDLMEEAIAFQERVSSQLDNLRRMQSVFEQNRNTMVDLSSQIEALNMRMMGLLQNIQERSEYYRTCKGT
ncbi:laminin subunit beta-1-like [Acanthaster planci]|uniref:Laminin subunit beta-1-like n=1 Tax=Acanthaster planci TaxID=133434 RepID=A0A8B7Z2U8_ACAPL|nr:laminin subunit beta-1-like [Acanthaster planci]XP_022099299.1 laminin subunit beta-1-like [Acanthaster planci]